ncbi:MAG: glycosyltransferase, partial [bacterium]
MVLAVVICIAGLTYIYVGYPVLIWVLARMCTRAGVRRGGGGALQCSVVIAAYHEGLALNRKVESILQSRDLDAVREIVIGLDGPPIEGDPTSEQLELIARHKVEDSDKRGGSGRIPRIRVVSFPERRGKAALLCELVPMASADILVMMDARQVIHPEAIRQLLANFTDESVGVVSGELVFVSGKEPPVPGVVQQGVGVYWLYEKFIRRCEGRFRSVPGATGALYAIRRNLFRPIPAGTLLDDVAIPMQAVEQGSRCVFEPGAEVYDAPAETAGREAVRKRRTIAGVVQLMCIYPRWMLPWHNPIWFEYVSHKLLRLCSPLLLAGLLISNLMVLAQPAFQLLLALQGVFYLLALG